MNIQVKTTEVRIPRRGRRARLSAATIVDGTLELLTTYPVEEISLALVAETVDATTMALYKYFPNRDALLEAVSARCFTLFRAPKRKGEWHESLKDWLWALQRHFDRYPVVQKMMGWENCIPSAWLRAIAPVIRLLEEQGFKGDKLALATEYFLSSALGLMLVEAAATQFRKRLPFEAMSQLPAEEQLLFTQLQPYRGKVNRQEVLERGFGSIIDGLRTMRAEFVA